MTQQILAAKQVAFEKLWKFRMLFFPGLDIDNSRLKRSEFWDLMKVFFGGVTFVSVIIAALAFLFQQRVVEKEYNWRRMKEAQDILKEWDKQTGQQKAAIESFFRRRHNWPAMDVIPHEEAEALSAALAPTTTDGKEPPDSGESELWTTKQQIVGLLNYFETISTAATLGIASEEILKESLGHSMMEWRDYLREFTNLMDRQRGRPVWKPYYEIVDRWRQDLRTSAPVQPAETKKPHHEWGTRW